MNRLDDNEVEKIEKHLDLVRELKKSVEYESDSGSVSSWRCRYSC